MTIRYTVKITWKTGRLFQTHEMLYPDAVEKLRNLQKNPAVARLQLVRYVTRSRVMRTWPAAPTKKSL